MTASLNHLNFPKPYTAQDHLTVGNGQNLPITHIGTALIPSSVSNLHLRNVLRVPLITSNLASVHKLCQDNNCWCYFDKNILSIQALDTGKSSTRVEVKMVSTQSIHIKLLNLLYLSRIVIMFLKILPSLGHCGT